MSSYDDGYDYERPDAGDYAYLIGHSVHAVRTDPNYAGRLVTALQANDREAVDTILAEAIEATLPPELRNKANNLRTRIHTMTDELLRLYAIPEEPQGAMDGSPPVVIFAKTFGRQDGSKWSYAAIRPKDGSFWYVTSRAERTQRFASWAKLWEFINKAEPFTPVIRVADRWKVL